MAVRELNGPSLAMQHFLYFLPLPQGQGALRAMLMESPLYHVVQAFRPVTNIQGVACGSPTQGYSPALQLKS